MPKNSVSQKRWRDAVRDAEGHHDSGIRTESHDPSPGTAVGLSEIGRLHCSAELRADGGRTEYVV